MRRSTSGSCAARRLACCGPGDTSTHVGTRRRPGESGLRRDTLAARLHGHLRRRGGARLRRLPRPRDAAGGRGHTPSARTSPGRARPTTSPQRFAEYQKGDLDAVRLEPDGTRRARGAPLAQRRRLQRGPAGRHPQHQRLPLRGGPLRVFNCARVTARRDRGDLYITTNHGVTLIQGLTYNSHRHPGWYLYDGRTGTHAPVPAPCMGSASRPNGDVLVANDRMVGVLVADGVLEDWDRENTWDGPVPWRFKGYNEALNSLETFDYWRAITGTKQGVTWVGSKDFGLWRMNQKDRSSADYTRLTALPSDNVTALAATDDGSVYVGTDDAGLWRIAEGSETPTRVDTVSGRPGAASGLRPHREARDALRPHGHGPHGAAGGVTEARGRLGGPSVRAHGLDGVQLRRARGRVDAEQQPHPELMKRASATTHSGSTWGQRSSQLPRNTRQPSPTPMAPPSTDYAAPPR